MIGYLLAFVSYVILGFFFKTWVLNWIVGPFYIVITMYYLPNALRRAGLVSTGGSQN